MQLPLESLQFMFLLTSTRYYPEEPLSDNNFIRSQCLRNPVGEEICRHILTYKIVFSRICVALVDVFDHNI